MITARELRIGNVARYKETADIRPEYRGQFRVISGSDIAEIEKGMDVMEAVLITPNLLMEHLGLRKTDDGSHWSTPAPGGVWLEEYRTGYRIVRPSFCSKTVFTLHHLQNLFFALFDTELPIKVK